MEVKENFSIKNLNTFAIDVKAKYFVEVGNQKELKEVLQRFKKENLFILGGGSNTLFVNDWDGLMLKINIKGKKVVKQENDFVFVECYAGEVWDDFVNWCVERNFAGVENMIFIPGTVGGAVAQNIGAYGQGIVDVLHEVEVFDVDDFTQKTLKPNDCNFEYRSSNFKKHWKNKYIITKAVFKLKKEGKDLELSYKERAGRYGSILEELKTFAKEPYTIQDVAKAVKSQREKRLPCVEEFGTCGSFFKNPVVSFKKFEELKTQIPDLQSYPVEGGGDFVKIPAGRLLDELGWRGNWRGNAGVFKNHALCVVNNKKAKGEEMVELAEEMKKTVREKYGVELSEEVNIVI